MERLKLKHLHHDLTDLLSDSDLYVHDEIARFGISGKITALAYDPVQSLLAVGTGYSDGVGKVYVFGQRRVEVVFDLSKKCNVNEIHFCARKKLLVWDSWSNITIIGLEESKVLNTYSPPGSVTAVATDPLLDWAFLGLDNGDILCYDVDRETLTPLRITGGRMYGAKGMVSPVVALSIHPRDIATLLIAWKGEAATYSISKNEIIKTFKFTLQPGAPGGDTDPGLVRTLRNPAITQAVWHPTGLFLLTAHEDGCLVFWDPKEAKLLQARTVQDPNVHQVAGIPGYGQVGGIYPAREPFFQVSWVSGENPEDCTILISGGNFSGSSGITLLEYGVNPSTITSSYQTLGEYFASPKKHRIFPTPPHNPCIKFLPLPKDDPHYNRSHNPHAIICLLSDSSLTTLAYPSSMPLSGALLHPSLSLHHPKADWVHVSPIDQQRWKIMKIIPSPEPFIQGGAELPQDLRRDQNRLLAKSVHNEEGRIRIWDIGRKDEIANGDILELDVFAAVGRGGVKVDFLDMSSSMGELVAGLNTGEFVIWRWDRNRKLQPPEPPEDPEQVPVIEDIRWKAPQGLREGLFPAYIVNEKKGKIVGMKLSSVGFLVVGYENGGLTIVDLRQPRIMMEGNFAALAGMKSKRLSLLKSDPGPTGVEVMTTAEFSVLLLDEDEYTSLNVHIATSHGKLYTYRLVPRQGVYQAELVGSLSCSTSVRRIAPIETYKGHSARANPDSVASLRDGNKVEGLVVLFAEDEVRICKPSSTKGTKESFNGRKCVTGNVAESEGHGVVAVCVMESGDVIYLSLPALNRVHEMSIANIGFDVTRKLDQFYVSDTGDLVGWLEDGQYGAACIWGIGTRLRQSKPSLLYNPQLAVPPRPTISNLQWIAGTQHITAEQLAELIFPNRPPPPRQPIVPKPIGRTNTASSQQGEGMWSAMQKGIEERTKNLNLMGDSMDRLGESAQSFSEEVDKFVKDAKRKALWGGIKGKFF